MSEASGSPVSNVVLVHGAWADGSGWEGAGVVERVGSEVTALKPGTIRR